MDNENLKNLFVAIKNDDVFRFSVFAKNKSDLSVCYGRFPVLSLCYLYKSYRILDLYEDSLIQIKKYTIVDEYYEIYLEFKKYAKKSIRLYLRGEIISPLEMLSIIDDRKKIANNYKKYEKNDEICKKVKKIYSLSHKTDVETDPKSFVAPSKDLEKKNKIILSSIALFLVFMIVFPILSIVFIKTNYGIGNLSSPIHISNETELATALKRGSKHYILEEDITLTENICVENFSGTINGNGKTILADSSLTGAIIKNLSGSIENLKLEINYEKLEIFNNLSFFAQNLTGNIKNCEISGYINGEFKNTEDAYLSLFVNKNDGIIENSVANLSADLKNTSSTNAFISAFSSENNGKIIGCKSTNSQFIVDTVDLACFAIDNNGTISDCENNIVMSQTSASEWHPNTAGIAVNNTGVISNTTNNADISSATTNLISSNDNNSKFVIYASGISIENSGTINDVVNNGNITSTSIVAESYASGVVVHNVKEVYNATNNGEVFASSDEESIFIAGIACYNSFTYEIVEQIFGNYYNLINISSIKDCVNNGLIHAESKFEKEENSDGAIVIDSKIVNVYGGGVAGFNYTSVASSKNYGNVVIDGKSSNIYLGGIVGSSSFVRNDVSLISDCTSQSNLTGNSSLSVAYVGGVVGYNTQTSMSKSGFDGKIILNSFEGYSGGISGVAENAQIISCYANTSYETTGKNCYTAGIVGYYKTNTYYILSSNNAYVEYKEIPPMYVFSSSENGLVKLDINNSGSTSFKTMQELLNYIESLEVQDA